jgi:hypothetical protein
MSKSKFDNLVKQNKLLQETIEKLTRQKKRRQDKAYQFTFDTRLTLLKLNQKVQREGVTIAVFLQDLIYREAKALRSVEFRKKKGLKLNVDDEGFFLCSTKFLSNPKYPPTWTLDKQNRYFSILEKMGVIQKKLKGLPAQRWIKIDTDWLDDLIDEALDLSLPSYGKNPTTGYGINPMLSNNTSYCINTNEKPRTFGSSASRDLTPEINKKPKTTPPEGKVTGDPDPAESSGKAHNRLTVKTNNLQTSDWDRLQAKKLRNLCAKKGWGISQSKKNWSVRFRIARTTEKRDPELIEEILDWYVSHALKEKDITPKCTDGKQFFSCFNWIQSNMDRYDLESPNCAPPENLKTCQDQIYLSIKDKGWPGSIKPKLKDIVGFLILQFQERVFHKLYNDFKTTDLQMFNFQKHVLFKAGQYGTLIRHVLMNKFFSRCKSPTFKEKFLFRNLKEEVDSWLKWFVKEASNGYGKQKEQLLWSVLIGDENE